MSLTGWQCVADAELRWTTPAGGRGRTVTGVGEDDRVRSVATRKALEDCAVELEAARAECPECVLHAPCGLDHCRELPWFTPGLGP